MYTIQHFKCCRKDRNSMKKVTVIFILLVSFTMFACSTAFAENTGSSYTLTLIADPHEGGKVYGGGTYSEGQNATVRAEPTPGYTFAGWYRPDEPEPFSMEQEFEFDLEVSRTYIAKFVTALTVGAIAEPANGGSVEGSGDYIYDETATLTATSSEGYSFIGWFDASSPANVLSTDSSYTFEVSQSVSFIARFAAQYGIAVNISPEGGGTVTGAGTYAGGSIVVLEATPNEDYRFYGWVSPADPDRVISSDPVYSRNLDDNLTLTARFSYSYRYIFSWVAVFGAIGAGGVVGGILLYRYLRSRRGSSSHNDPGPD